MEVKAMVAICLQAAVAFSSTFPKSEPTFR